MRRNVDPGLIGRRATVFLALGLLALGASLAAALPADASTRPIVESVEPGTGPTAGATEVTIRGRNFSAGAAFTVTIGSQATSLVRRSATELTARTAATSAGAYEVVVSDSHGASTGGPSFTYVAPPPPAQPPRVLALEPVSGSTAGGTTVTITGAGFLPGAKVDVCGEATAVEVRSETEITATTASCAAGSDEVVVSDADGVSSGGPSFTYVVPPGEASAGGSSGPSGGESSGSGEAAIAGFATGGAGLANLGAGIEASSLPAPVLAHSFDVEPSGGILRVRLPGAHAPIALDHPRQVPVGSILDTTEGVVTITAATASGGIQTGQFFGGLFALGQGSDGLVVATLVGGNFSACRSPRQRDHHARSSSGQPPGSRIVRRLWANARGSFATRGSDAAGAVTDTEWLTEDLCAGTLIRVTRAKVSVTDLVDHRHVTVTAGHSYLAGRTRAARRPSRAKPSRPAA